LATFKDSGATFEIFLATYKQFGVLGIDVASFDRKTTSRSYEQLPRRLVQTHPVLVHQERPRPRRKDRNSPGTNAIQLFYISNIDAKQ
jgi:hypothetical protein